ncbi:MAG: hypothetical protein OEQ53_03645 [Saprospiraceae bacterium]|nr:hypothetical protein [Saprospiraceae bacterium]
MKSINKDKVVTLILTGLLILSCDSDFAPPHENVPFGGFVRFEESISSGTIDIADPSAKFEATLVAPSNNISNYELTALVVKADTSIGPVTLKNVTSFPSTLEILPSEIAAAVNMQVSDLDPGDRIDLFANVTRSDGQVFTANDFTGDLLNPGQRQAMQFSIFLVCAFNASDAVGNYLIVTDPFVTSLDFERPIEAKAGPGEDQITFINMFSHPEGYDIVVTVTDPPSGAASVSKQPAWHCDNFGCPFGEGRVEGTGLFFSCTGFLTLDLTHTVDAGSFGSFKMELQKQ